MAWPAVEFRPKKLMRAAMVADVLLTGRDWHLARKGGHDASMGFRGDAQIVQPGRHLVPEYTATARTAPAVNLLLANPAQAANIALARVAIDTDRFDQNGVPVHPALQPGSFLPSREHAVV